MRQYEKTHPWITFKLDLKKSHTSFWMNLGETISKCEHLSRAPLRPETARRLHLFYLAKGAAATTAIEGNSLSEEDVLKAVEGKLEVPPSREYLKQEVDNIIAECNAIGKQLADGVAFNASLQLIQHYNYQVLNKLPLKEDVIPGQIRTKSVVVGNIYRGAPAEDCDYLLIKLCDWLNGDDFKAEGDMKVVYAILKAVMAHIYLAWIHPFGDGNGRTARLIEFHILLSAGIPSPAAHLLSNHYNQTRSEYYRQLDYASKSGGDLVPFLEYAIQGFLDGLHEQLESVWDQHFDIVWINYVHDLFQQKEGPSDIRQRRLALDLGMKRDWVQIQDIRELTPRLVKAYATKTMKTVQRDLNVLNLKGLILREGRKVRAKREVIQSFLPFKSQNK